MRWTSERSRCGVDTVRVRVDAARLAGELEPTLADRPQRPRRASSRAATLCRSASAMVLLHVKRSDKDTFLFDTPAATEVDVRAPPVVAIHNLRQKIGRLAAQVEAQRRTAR